MHPAIAETPYLLVYNGLVTDGVKAEDFPLPLGFPWPRPKIPVCVINCTGDEVLVNAGLGPSYHNPTQAAVATKIVRMLHDGTGVSDGCAASALGIIVGYAPQSSSISTGGSEIGTIDRFQGHERNIIIVVTVRSTFPGFLASRARFNVALTRARRGLIVICKTALFEQEQRSWAPWLHWAKEAGVCMEASALS